MKLRHSLFLLIMLMAAPKVSAIHFRHLTMKEGLSQLSVMSIYQDKVGRMWFGTEEGINVYDGNSMFSYKYYVGDNLKIGIDALYIDGDAEGNVYCCSGSALLKFDLMTQKTTCLIRTNVSAMACHGNNIYFVWSNALCVMRAGHHTPHVLCRLAPGQYGKCIKIDSRGRCFLGTNTGLYVCCAGRQLRCLIPHVEISQIFEDSHRNIWVSTMSRGCYVLKADGTLEHITAQQQTNWQSVYSISSADVVESSHISSNMVRGIAEDNEGNIWLGTFLGLNKYDAHTGRFCVYGQTNNPYSMSHSSVFPVFKDNKGTIWTGTYYGGVNYFNPQRDIFTFYPADVEKDDCLSSPIVGHMVEDKRGDLWICTEGGGLNCLHRRTGKITHYLAWGSGSNSIVHNTLKCIVYDAKADRLYIGTHTGGISIYDIRSGRFNNIYLIHSDYAAHYGDQIYWMSLDGNRLIFTSELGLWQMDITTGQIAPLFKSGRLYGLSYFFIDSRGYIWIAAKYMLYRVNLANEADQEVYRCGKKGLGDYFITDMNITEDSHGQIYVAVFGSGLYRYDRASDSFSGYTTSNSNIISDYCYEVQSYKNKLLINTDRGFSIFDTGNKDFWNIEIASDFPLTGIHRGCGMTGTHDGAIFVGGTNGLASFDVRRTLGNDLHYQLYISRLFLGNHEVLPTDSTGILSKTIRYTHRIDLAFDQNDITLHFTTNNYIGFYRHPLYEYKLEGYENHWTQTYERRIGYTKIAPGSYTLIIRERPMRNGRIQHEARIEIVVHPPFYKTTLAYLLYIAAFAGLLYYVYRFKRSQLLLTMSLEQEKKDKKNIIDLNQAKLQFFTNISHEFRTPLTLLIAKLDTFLSETSQGSALHRKFDSLQQNANHLLSLVNELLDFRKIEQGHISLHVTENDIVSFARSIYKSFEDFAHDHHINYVFSASEPSILCWYDSKQMEKVVLNLLSNAFKFTNANKGYVELKIGTNGNNVMLQVLDNGIGIEKKDLTRIFERFYQVGNDFKSIVTMSGTGIGLALVKDILEAHHGSVHVESSPSYGSVFIALLPKGNSHFTPEELSTEPQIQSNPSDPSNQSVPSNQTTQNYTILIVEDNEEMQLILNDLFSKTYHVLLANDGKEGLDLVRNSGPDLVLSDVMMPVMSGIELCKAIKDDLTICHIPVVLLTAMGSTEHELNGLRCGADDYIAKPFEPRLLLARCNNLISTRQMLRQSAMEKKSDIALLATNPLDKTFLQTCNTFIEENIDNSEFSVDTLAHRMNMGRTTFFNKFKALTGVTPNDYVLSYRLHLSAILLKQNTVLQVADIAYQFGFNSPNYFSQCFKKKYGITPTEFRVSGEDVLNSK